MDKLLFHKRLYLSVEDLKMAKYFGAYILKKGWHFARWERRMTTYYNQAAYTIGLIVSYARPFTVSKETDTVRLPPLKNLIKEILSEQEFSLHEYILNLRHNVFAHSAGRKYKTTPIMLGDFATAVYNEPGFYLEKDKVVGILNIIEKLISEFEDRNKSLTKELAANTR